MLNLITVENNIVTSVRRVGVAVKETVNDIEIPEYNSELVGCHFDGSKFINTSGVVIYTLNEGAEGEQV